MNHFSDHVEFMHNLRHLVARPFASDIEHIKLPDERWTMQKSIPIYAFHKKADVFRKLMVYECVKVRSRHCVFIMCQNGPHYVAINVQVPPPPPC